MVNTKTTLCGIELDNPVIPASGTFGYGHEFAELYDINCLGTLSMKGSTRDARFGNPTPRIAECAGGMMNSVGLQNPGIDAVIANELPKLRKVFHKPIMANICGYSLEEYAENAAKMDKAEQVAWLEINISCPNVKAGGAAFGTDVKLASEVIRTVREATTIPLITKLSPNVTSIAEFARAAEACGSDMISLINTLSGMAIDIETRRPKIANLTGGLSGPAVKPVAVRMVYEASRAVKIPVIGMGGIMTGDDAVEFLLAGASAIAVGTANFVDPMASIRVLEGIEAYLDRHGIASVSELVGALQI